MNFKSFKALEKFLKTSIGKAIKDEPPKAVRNLMRRNIIKEVYSVYKPEIYERRYNNDGLLSEKNIISKPKKGNIVEIYNIAKRNIRYTNQYLAPVIEFGHKGAIDKGYRGYTFPRPMRAYYQERPFIRVTREDLFQKKSHVHAMKQSLKKLGISSKLDS
jgi:hypothetical protein